jgi:hypothetical protein
VTKAGYVVNGHDKTQPQCGEGLSRYITQWVELAVLTHKGFDACMCGDARLEAASGWDFLNKVLTVWS